MKPTWKKIIYQYTLPAAFVLVLAGSGTGTVKAQEHNWHSHAEVARKVIHTFEDLKTYSARFEMVSRDGGKTQNMSGTVYFSKPGKVLFDFDRPSGDFILSDGKIMWIYLKRRNVVGKQDLSLKKENESGSMIFSADPDAGISRLFRKYHYRFDTVKQPREIDGQEVFVLDLDQREKIGGYENIKLHIDTKTYLIKRAIGTTGSGKTTTISFQNIQINPPIEGKKFQYKPDDRVRVVLNPLVNE